MKKIGIICGGPSLERGISLNSSRSLLDHLSSLYDISLLFVDTKENFYKLDRKQIYSNTPSDFDFKLREEDQLKTKKEILEVLRAVDIIFPAIHGNFGETGELQVFLEKHKIPFIGCGAYTCQNMFFKNLAKKVLSKHSMETLPMCYLHAKSPHNDKIVEDFFKKYHLDRAIVKPTAGGSSIGVFSVNTPKIAMEKLKELFSLTNNADAMIEPFCYGKEFTILVLQNKQGSPVALIPSEINISYTDNQIFDYRRKYLPTGNTEWPTPARFSDKILKTIRAQAEKIFEIFHMRHFARLDGWLLDDGRIIFTDLNPISGMEQNSFLFLQASRCGMTHADVLNYIVETALNEYEQIPACA